MGLSRDIVHQIVCTSFKTNSERENFLKYANLNGLERAVDDLYIKEDPKVKKQFLILYQQLSGGKIFH